MTDELHFEKTQPMHRYLTAPLAHIGEWTRYFTNAEIPVFASTVRELAALNEIEDDVDANMLTPVIQADPLMSLKLMRWVASLRKSGDRTDTESITSSLVFVGIGPFFRAFRAQYSVEDWLSDQPRALQGLQFLLHRSERAGQFALAFALHRGDMDATIIHHAAFLHDFVEMLLWIHAPTLAVAIHDAQAADPTLRTSAIQREVLGIEAIDLRQALMQLWHLPQLLVQMSDDRHADRPNVQCVVLAERVARHSSHGWDNPALPDDYDEVAALLNASPRVVPSFLRKIDHPILEATKVRGLMTLDEEDGCRM
ncbi:HDOD domain-containing protein [Candidatus Symbiobacter mobilis]|uniref:Signal transduction family protein n=1 Tax=Candidatus Symbiobacter mobilis CR TaxID=946483 RepID=U5NAP6_9BURK|nr:HDOD domain-containing protein [Candidatus Symbiobacter mobilis]AGX88360.1 signal transduction family protein [Candidatus Symbiobacter mobilis CR]